MKKLIALVLAMVMLATLFVACGETNTEDTETTTTTTKKTTTLPLPPEPESDEPEIPAETPVTGEEFPAWHESMNLVQIISATTDGISHWGDGPVESLFDGADGYLNTEADFTKMGGGASAGCYVIVEVPADTKVSAYAFITGNDSATYAGRTPGEWNVYATNADPATATDEDWTLIDYVYDGATQDADFTPFGYTIDDDKVAGYQYYKFEFLFGITGALGAIQLCELYLYTTPAA